MNRTAYKARVAKAVSAQDKRTPEDPHPSQPLLSRAGLCPPPHQRPMGKQLVPGLRTLTITKVADGGRSPPRSRPGVSHWPIKTWRLTQVTVTDYNPLDKTRNHKSPTQVTPGVNGEFEEKPGTGAPEPLTTYAVNHQGKGPQSQPPSVPGPVGRRGSGRTQNQHCF